MNEDDCFPLLLSQRERSTLELDTQKAARKVEVADWSNRHDLPEDDFPTESSDPDKTVTALLNESPPAA
jgi:hypothetical protein